MYKFFPLEKANFKKELNSVNDNQIVKVDEADYRLELQHLSDEINETFKQIDNELSIVNGKQAIKLREYKETLLGILDQ